MALEIIVSLIIAAIIVFVIYKITSSVIKAAYTGITIITLILVTLGLLVYYDSANFMEQSSKQPSLYLFEDDGKISAGFSGVFGDSFKPNYATLEELAVYQKLYSEGDLKSILGSNYKLFIINKGAFSSVEEVSGILDLTKDEMLSMISSEDPVQLLVKKQVGDVPGAQISRLKQELLSKMGLKNEAEFKGAVFTALFAAALDQEGTMFIFSKEKEGAITVYPDTAMFKFAKTAPSFMVEMMVPRGE